MIYSPYTDIEEYLLDDYEGRQEIAVGDAYNIPDSNLHVFTLSSDPEGDAKEIYALYPRKPLVDESSDIYDSVKERIESMGRSVSDDVGHALRLKEL